MRNAVDCSLDPQNTLFLRIFGSKDLARQRSRLGLALAGEGVPPGRAVCGWNWPFRLSDRRADHYPTEWHRTATSNTLTAPCGPGQCLHCSTACGAKGILPVDCSQPLQLFLAVADHFGSAAPLVKSR